YPLPTSGARGKRGDPSPVPSPRSSGARGKAPSPYTPLPFGEREKERGQCGEKEEKVRERR
ncbi:MAG: hypothetical protein NC929_04355, partial [Candidatus Omnitrophica bacterium]|nr:hypothetical protein [Candidatus Omnitrophota bacterium]